MEDAHVDGGCQQVVGSGDGVNVTRHLQASRTKRKESRLEVRGEEVREGRSVQQGRRGRLALGCCAAQTGRQGVRPPPTWHWQQLTKKTHVQVELLRRASRRCGAMLVGGDG